MGRPRDHIRKGTIKVKVIHGLGSARCSAALPIDYRVASSRLKPRFSACGATNGFLFMSGVSSIFVSDVIVGRVLPRGPSSSIERHAGDAEP